MTHIYMSINDIHFKYILASARDLILTFVAHPRKKAELRLWGLGGED